MWIGLLIRGELAQVRTGFFTSRWCEANSAEEALAYHRARIAAELSESHPGVSFTLEIEEVRESIRGEKSSEGSGFTFYESTEKP
jgi:hypothetical protein